MVLLFVTLGLVTVSVAGLGLGLLIRGRPLEGSCGGGVEIVDGKFVKKACGTCKKAGKEHCDRAAAPG